MLVTKIVLKALYKVYFKTNYLQKSFTITSHYQLVHLRSWIATANRSKGILNTYIFETGRKLLRGSKGVEKPSNELNFRLMNTECGRVAGGRDKIKIANRTKKGRVTNGPKRRLGVNALA